MCAHVYFTLQEQTGHLVLHGMANRCLVDPENLELESQLCLQTTLVRPGLLRHKLKSVMNSFTDLVEVSEGTADSVILSSA